ncbi:MAG: hypothetical protein LBD48_14100 [Treponema sp.]|nr:hypothetical protein [Treponema sp.]
MAKNSIGVVWKPTGFPNRSIVIRNALFVIFVTACFTLPASSLFARGAAEAAGQTTLNNEWTLCVTGFDISGLPASGNVIGSVITRSLVNILKTVSYRIRVSPEYAFYEGYAWNHALTETARKLSAKQDERSLLLYRGEPDWKYRQNLKRIDAEIQKLREELTAKEAERPLINAEPVFTMTQGNRDGTFPPPPLKGGEYRFCKSQNADAFLAGSVREYHGRYYVVLRLYTLYTRSFVYEDNIIFSTDDTAGAVDEIAGRLTAVLAGSKPAAIAVHAGPPESLVLINQTFAGRGTVEAKSYPPGKAVVAVSANEYQPETIETELKPGELTEISVMLAPLLYSDVNISIPGKSGVSVYQGAMYVGEAPLTLRLPINQLEYISLYVPGGESATAVFTSPDIPGESSAVSLQAKIPPPAGQQRVNKARSWYYWAWGGTWISGIAAWVTYGIYSGQTAVLSQSSSQEFFTTARSTYYISVGTIALVGVAVAYEVFQMARYLYTATEDATPVVKQRKKQK